MMQRYFYPGATPTHSRILCLEHNTDLRFSIGSAFDTYDFTQKLPISFRDLLVERLKQIRQQAPYWRLWFSGGKDSRLILDTAIREHILPDEILTIVHQPAGAFSLGAQVELEFNAVRYVQDLGLPAEVRHTVIQFQPEHYAAGFRDGSWIHDMPLYNFHAPFNPGVFFSKVNPEFELVQKSDDVADISGNTHPHVVWSGTGWQFFYVDRQFCMDTNDFCENFLACDSMPELTHAYVSAVIGAYQHTVVDGQPQTFGADRVTRDQIREYHEIRQPRPDLEMPKYYDGSWYPGDSRVWMVNNNYKHWVNCVACFGQDPLPASMRTYLDSTDWNRVKISHGHAGIITHRFDCA